MTIEEVKRNSRDRVEEEKRAFEQRMIQKTINVIGECWNEVLHKKMEYESLTIYFNNHHPIQVFEYKSDDNRIFFLTNVDSVVKTFRDFAEALIEVEMPEKQIVRFDKEWWQFWK
jgi:hypothetical protein